MLNFMISTAMRGAAIGVLGVVAAPLAAESSVIVAGFEAATLLAPDAKYKTNFEIDGCIFKRTTVDPVFCALAGKGDGDRTFVTTIDLSEVRVISTMLQRGKFHMSFELDHDEPGGDFIAKDLRENGAEGLMERFIERRKAALDKAELRSAKSLSRCDGSPPHIRKEAVISVISNAEPEGWRLLVDLARECRAPKSLELKES